MNLLNALLALVRQLLGGNTTQAADDPHITTAPAHLTPSSTAPTPVDEPGSGGGNAMNDITSHALVLPDADFRSWYEATRDYTAHFKRVVIVRSPAGNNLNRYKVVTAVKTGRVWFNGDPVAHIRRAYPNVVTVDVIDTTSPTALKRELDRRVAAGTRIGTNLDTRFTLDWPTDSYTLAITRDFDVPLGNNRFHEGIDMAVTAGTPVRAACDGTVFAVTTDSSSLGYGTYVQLKTRARDGTEYLVTTTNLTGVSVSSGQSVREGDLVGTAASAVGVKLIVQQAGLNTGNRYRMPGAVDPVPLLFVDDIRLETTAALGLNIREGRGTDYDSVGKMAPDETAIPLGLHGSAIRQTGTSKADDQWINVDTSSGVTGFVAAWFLEARSPRSAPATGTALNGINLDRRHPLGSPDPSRLGAMSYVRMAYNVSDGRGSQDLNAAYNHYAPYLDQLARAGKKIILVYTHQTYGEGAGFVWERMTADKWRELGARYADFLRVIAGQYRGMIAAHQIWNEQDAYQGAAASVTMRPQDYATILNFGIQAIRAVDSTTPIITGGHTAGPQLGSSYARQTLAALPAAVRPDGIAVHPYGRGTGDNPRYEIFGNIDETVREYSAVMPGKPIWITEWGVLDLNGDPAGDISAYATDFLDRVRTRHASKVAATVWYAWAEGMHNGYGLVNRSDQPREPLYSKYTSFT